MNPVVLAAVAISLVSLAMVSMASIASQQAVNNASLQKTILERDRLAEQTNAFISAVTPAGSNTVATIKNTGTNAVTIDHCLVLSPSSNSRPVAAKIPDASAITVSPSSRFDITVPGAASGDNIKCVTSKGTLLQVRLEGDGESQGEQQSPSPDPNNYFDLYSISADVGIRTAASYSTGNVIPVNRPSDPPLTIPPGTLTYHIPVEGTVTVSSAVAYYDDGTSGPIVQGPAKFGPGQRIDIPVTKSIDRVEVSYVDPATSRQSSFIVRPSQLAAMTSTILSGPTVVGMDVSQGAGDGYMYMADGSRQRVGHIYSTSKYANQLGYGGPGGRMRCSGSWINIIPVYQGFSNGIYESAADVHCINGWNSIYLDPVSTINIKFMAPKPSFLLQIDYVVDVQGGTSDSNSYPGPFSAMLDINNGQRQVQLPPDSITDVWQDSDSLYHADHRIAESGSVTLQFTNAAPGQEVTVPVSLHVHGSTNVKLACGCSSYPFSGRMSIGSPNALSVGVNLVS